MEREDETHMTVKQMNLQDGRNSHIVELHVQIYEAHMNHLGNEVRNQSRDCQITSETLERRHEAIIIGENPISILSCKDIPSKSDADKKILLMEFASLRLINNVNIALDEESWIDQMLRDHSDTN